MQPTPGARHPLLLARPIAIRAGCRPVRLPSRASTSSPWPLPFGGPSRDQKWNGGFFRRRAAVMAVSGLLRKPNPMFRPPNSNHRRPRMFVRSSPSTSTDPAGLVGSRHDGNERWSCFCRTPSPTTTSARRDGLGASPRAGAHHRGVAGAPRTAWSRHGIQRPVSG